MTDALYPFPPGLYTRLCSTCREWKPTDDGRRWHYRQCADCYRAYCAARYAANRDERLAYATEYQKTERGKETHRRAKRKYAQTEAGKAAHRRKERTRRAVKRNAVCKHGVGCFDDAARVMRRRCAACGKRNDIQADHIQPLAQGGLDCRQNLQPLCRHCNTAKQDKLRNANATGYLL